MDETLSSAFSGALDLSDEPSKIIVARGTEDGLVLRIDGRSEWSEILSELEAFLGERKKFLEGGEVSLEWLDRLPTKEQSQELEIFLKERYGIQILARRKGKSQLAAKAAMNRELIAKDTKIGGRRPSVTIPLFDAVEEGPGGSMLRDSIQKEVFSEMTSSDNSGEILPESMVSFSVEDEKSSDIGRKYLNRMARVLGDDVFYEEDANAKILFGTLRSGQRVETPFSLIIVGDVNPGADLIAGGDILVFGSLRGTAHASAYDDEGTDRIILALHMQPMQLRIGSVISRGSDETVKGAEIARIEDRRIIVEPYNARASYGRKLR